MTALRGERVMLDPLLPLEATSEAVDDPGYHDGFLPR